MTAHDRRTRLPVEIEKSTRLVMSRLNGIAYSQHAPSALLVRILKSSVIIYPVITTRSLFRREAEPNFLQPRGVIQLSLWGRETKDEKFRAFKIY